MPTAQEKAAFSERLKCALRKSDPPVKDATDLARLFNLQHRAVSCIGIAVQAAHKWLSGLAIPSADKIDAGQMAKHVRTLIEEFKMQPERKRRVNKEMFALLARLFTVVARA